MRTITVVKNINAMPEIIWKTLSNLQLWQDWTPTVSKIESITSQKEGAGTKVRIFQPRLQPAIWEVTDWQAGKGFSWTSKRPGLQLTGEHYLEQKDEGVCRIRLTMKFEGLLAMPVYFLTKKLTLRYMTLEAEGLQLFCEHSQTLSPQL